jgi:hypothetical protein
VEAVTVHIREMVWRGETVKEVTTLCGQTDGGSISWEHMRKAYDSSLSSAVARHVKSLELCDDCVEDFKRRHDPVSYQIDND